MKELKVIANELVPVYENGNKENWVNARDLHAFLNVGREFAHWVKERIEKYGLQEGLDYSPVLANRSDGLPGKGRKEYYLRMDVAKELAMVENNEQGKKVRQYFIAVEKKAREMFVVPKSLPEALRYAAELAEKIEQDKPKVIFAETMLKSEDSILIRELAKLAHDNEGINIGEHKLYAWLRKNKILMPNNEPYQRFVNAGYFEVTQKYYTVGESVRLVKTTRVLPKGQAYIINRLKKAV